MTETKKNILLFRGENKQKMQKTLQAWRERFIEKYWEINLLDIRNDNIFEGVLSDCMTPGFMGSSRMIIFYEKLLKTDKEIKKIQEEKQETINLEDILNGTEELWKNEKDDDSYWLQSLEKIPDTNFVLFIGNKKPVTELEKWLEKNATIHEFPAPTLVETIKYIETELRLPREQAEKMSDRLNNNPDFVEQEVKKLALAFQPRWSDDELKSILPDYRDENAFNMLTPLWNRDPKSMISIWKRLMETADHELTVAMMITMIRKILIAASFQQIGNLPIAPTQRSTGKRLMWNKKWLKKLYDDIVAIDIAEKSGELPGKTNAFLMALLNFC